ncbi:MAG: DUF3343 domain-containing protein [Deltaproteobacteria bacterium]|jgi:hypothetical protein|nr:DUF3343 domain-containing protein [Deltaproteobacteria bacterium]
MAEENGEIILVFASNTIILEVEELLEEKELPFVLIPVPKEVNPNCGLAVSFLEEDKDPILRELDRANLWPQSSYLRKGDDFRDYPVSRI